MPHRCPASASDMRPKCRSSALSPIRFKASRRSCAFTPTGVRLAARPNRRSTKAQQLGLTKFFNATKTATSTVAVIDPRNGHVYQTFYNDGQLDEYRKVIDAA